MHFNLYVPIQLALLATAVLARPTNHGLMKRHFLCDGAESESICPEGQAIVPIDDYACSVIKSAGRLNKMPPSPDGESSTTCPQQPPPPPYRKQPPQQPDQLPQQQ